MAAFTNAYVVAAFKNAFVMECCKKIGRREIALQYGLDLLPAIYIHVHDHVAIALITITQHSDLHFQ